MDMYKTDIQIVVNISICVDYWLMCLTPLFCVGPLDSLEMPLKKRGVSVRLLPEI